MGDFFPLLPEESRKVGDQWTNHTETSAVLGNIELTSKFDNHYTLIGVEDLDGVSCLKIKGESTGILEGTGAEGRLTLEGDLECETIYHWDYQRGVLAGYDYQMFGEATMAMTGRGTLSYVIENNMEITLGK